MIYGGTLEADYEILKEDAKIEEINRQISSIEFVDEKLQTPNNGKNSIQQSTVSKRESL